MFKKFVEKGGFGKKRGYSAPESEYNYSSGEYDEYEDDEDSENEHDSPKNAYSSHRSTYQLASEIRSSTYPYASRCEVEIDGSARFLVHIWCEREDEYRVTRIIETDYSDEPIGNVVIHYV